MKKLIQNKISVVTLFVFVGVVVVFMIGNTGGNSPALIGEHKQQKPRIAICPTFHEAADVLDGQGYVVVKTTSTSEGIELLNRSEVEFVLSGRIPFPEERHLNHKRLEADNRYSFLAQEAMTLLVRDLSNVKVYTDQPAEIILDVFGIDNLIWVDDVYNLPSDGVVITTWENTDFSRASVVNILNEDGTRHKNSRSPVVYCNCNEEIDDMRAVIQEIISGERV